MLSSSRIILGIPTNRYLRLAAVAAPIAILMSLLVIWLIDHEGTPEYWQVVLVFLTVVESTYIVVAAGVLVGMPLLALLAIQGRRIGARRPIVARALLIVVSLGMGLTMAESIAAVWRHRMGRSTVVPVGGLKRGPRVSPRAMWPPISLADVKSPEQFPDPPGDDEIDLVVVGESSAEGVPYNEWLSIGRMVAWRLEEAIPGRRIHVEILANSGDTLEIQHQKLERLTRRPDLMIVYCGHNEFGSRLHGGRDIEYYIDDGTPGLGRLLVEKVEAASPLCGLIRQVAEKCRLGIPPSARGDRDLVDRPAYTAGEYSLLLADFRRRLGAIVSYAGRVGAAAVLVIPPGNDAGFEPNRSFLPAATPRAQREAFRRDFLEARRLEDGDPAAAIAAYRALIDRQPGFAEAHYRLGLLLDGAGESEAAYRHFIAARDGDGYPVRCLTAFQDVYREVASRHDAILVDGQAELHAIGRHGQIDDRLFQDAMHPSLRGQIAIAQAILRALRARRAFGWPQDAPAPVIDPAECAAHFGLIRESWKKICLWGIHFGTFCQGLRYDPEPRMRKKRMYAEAYERLVAGAPIEGLGLPNLGIPEPVPGVADRDRSPTERSHHP